MSEEQEEYRVVSGNRMTVTRLDAEGKPTGEEPITFPVGAVVPEWQREAAEYSENVLGPALKRMTMEVTFKDVSPDMMGLLFGLSKAEVRRIRRKWRRQNRRLVRMWRKVRRG